MRGEGRGEERRGTSTGYKGGERKEGQGKGKRREGRIEAGRKGGRKETSLSPIHRVLDIYIQQKDGFGQLSKARVGHSWTWALPGKLALNSSSLTGCQGQCLSGSGT